MTKKERILKVLVSALRKSGYLRFVPSLLPGLTWFLIIIDSVSWNY